MTTITSESLSSIQVKGQKGKSYMGKVRYVFFTDDGYIVIVTSDKISAFDVVLPPEIPGKGAILNMMAARAFRKTTGTVPNYFISAPHQNVTIGHAVRTFKVEMVIRAYLTGHAWREYKSGKRMICGVPMPEGMKENDKFPQPIITPTTKALVGHDEDISREEIISSGLVLQNDYEILENYTHELFKGGTLYAEKQGLILVDTKYEFGFEFGKPEKQIMVIDEIHTPDSSRYFYLDGYEERQRNGEPQKQLSKEFVREWLMENGFEGKEGQILPEFTREKVLEIAGRYSELFTQFIGREPHHDWFKPLNAAEIQQVINNELEIIRGVRM